jgi:hypothetical protein
MGAPAVPAYQKPSMSNSLVVPSEIDQTSGYQVQNWHLHPGWCHELNQPRDSLNSWFTFAPLIESR